MSKCPTCGSPYPQCHPALQFEGEIEICVDDFHLADTPEARPYHSLVLDKRHNIEVKDSSHD